MIMLDAISPIDGRYRNYTEPLVKFFSEEAFMKYRVHMEGEYLIALSQVQGIGLRKLTKTEIVGIRELAKQFSAKDAEAIKEIEATTNHDLKAIEYWMKSKLKETTLANAIEWIHFGLTTWDATNIPYALMLQDALQEVLIPELEKIAASLKFKNVPMLARTHGQPASPTTFGKEMAVFRNRLQRQLEQLKQWKALAKLNGATGNYNALVAAYPKIDWIAFSKKFIRSLGLEPNLVTTQIEPYDNFAELFDTLRRINSILIDFNQDMWRYISDEWIIQKAIAGEVGSSTMPHKINPIQFENSEGNLGLANALLNHFSQKLPISRLQRDLSDSTVLRSIGSAFAYSMIAYHSLQNGLSRIAINETAMREALVAHPEVLAEAIQTILRREGVPMPYEKLKELTRGKQLTLEDLRKFIENLEIDQKIKEELLTLTPETYVGLAEKLAQY
ncbi:MAG: adenylosuccinate lyase [Patescibacteria group bacterium]